MKKELILVCNGDANDINTWSNVPFFIQNELKKQGYKIHYINTGARTKIGAFVHKSISKILRQILNEGNKYDIRYFNIYKYIKEQEIKKCLEKNPNVERIVYLCEVPSKLPTNKIPCNILIDFTIEYAIKVLEEREPTKREKLFIQKQDHALMEFQSVFVLFQDACDHYKTYYNTEKFHALKGHIINSLDLEYSKEEMLKNREISRNFLFIGRKKYINGMMTIVEAIKRYNQKFAEKTLTLTIIGITKEQLGIDEDWINCRGYLSKNNNVEKKTYYKEILTARAIVNTTVNWGGMSSTVEAMWFGCPVITSDYAEFIRLFGNNIDFGYYCKPEDIDSLYERIIQIMDCNKDEYRRMCLTANDSVKGFTWSACVEQLLKE